MVSSRLLGFSVGNGQTDIKEYIFGRYGTVIGALVALIATLVAPSTAFAQVPSVPVNSIFEIVLESTTAYSHPIRDVDVRAVFTGPDGLQIEQAAYWDGYRRFKIRFAPPEEGDWTYCTTSSDASNAGLHDICGAFTAVSYPGDNPFKKNGWPRISDDNRYLTYANREPLFLLVDAILEVSWKSTLEEVDLYIEDRVSKGFNTAWVVPMSHQYIYPNGVRNRVGQEYFIGDNMTLLNPNYFTYLDEVINRMNDAGIIVLLNPIWGRMATVYDGRDHQRTIDHETSLLHARYIGARYAANNIIWLIAGDARYEEQEIKDYWNAFAEELDRTSGNRHLLTAHATGYHGSHNYFEKEEWLDFHTYTGASLIEGEYSWRGAIQTRNTEPPKPSINIEYNFEDIYDRFWLFWGDTTNAVRMTSEDVRRGAYQSILSGAIAGISYGGNGLWQWTTPETLSGFGVRRTAVSALDLEGSRHMAVLKQLMTRFRWYTFKRFDGLIEFSVSDRRVAAAGNDEIILAYLPSNTESVSIYSDSLWSRFFYEWIDPRTGAVEETHLPPFLGENVSYFFVPPDDRDWLLAIHEQGSTHSRQPEEPRREELLVDVFPNPFQSTTTMAFQLPESGTLTVEVFDAIGRRVLLRTQYEQEGLVSIPITVSARGLYLYRVSLDSSGYAFQSTGTILSR